MTRINTNIPSMLGSLYMQRNMKGLQIALERLATGTRINSARDDPAGTITSDVLRGELTGISSAISNAERADNLMATAEGSLAEVADLLLGIKEILVEVANTGDLTPDEIKTRQVQVDSNIQAINQIVQSATIGGQKLLDGSLGYQTEDVDSAVISGLAVNKAPVGASAGDVPVTVALTTPAERASLTWPQATLAGDVTVRFSGPEGSRVLEFKAGTTSTEIVTAISNITGTTGLKAELVGGDPLQGVHIYSDDYGSAANVRVEVTAGSAADFATEDDGGTPAASDSGVDAVLNVNGSQVIAQGLEAHYASATLDLDLTIAEAWNTAGLSTPTTFAVTDGGALFQVGPQIGFDQQTSIGVAAMDSGHLGMASVGTLSDIASGGSKTLATGAIGDLMKIVDAATDRVTTTRSRIGSFQTNTLQVAVDSLKQAQENVSAAHSSLVDADYAEETARATQQQILVQASQAAATMAQQMPQYVLQLLMGI